MNTKLIGALGEYHAARHLREKGYDIFSGNFSSNTGEIDIVAFKDNVISFVEVKTRTIGAMFSRPHNGDASRYLPTQYIAEEIKNIVDVYISDIP